MCTPETWKWLEFMHQKCKEGNHEMIKHKGILHFGSGAYDGDLQDGGNFITVVCKDKKLRAAMLREIDTDDKYTKVEITYSKKYRISAVVNLLTNGRKETMRVIEQKYECSEHAVNPNEYFKDKPIFRFPPENYFQ